MKWLQLETVKYSWRLSSGFWKSNILAPFQNNGYGSRLKTKRSWDQIRHSMRKERISNLFTPILFTKYIVGGGGC